MQQHQLQVPGPNLNKRKLYNSHHHLQYKATRSQNFPSRLIEHLPPSCHLLACLLLKNKSWKTNKPLSHSWPSISHVFSFPIWTEQPQECNCGGEIGEDTMTSTHLVQEKISCIWQRGPRFSLSLPCLEEQQSKP